MRDRVHPESLVTSPTRTSSAERQDDSFETRSRYEQACREQEKHWSRNLQSLQECICELLIKNQELRMSLLQSAANQAEKAD